MPKKKNPNQQPKEEKIPKFWENADTVHDVVMELIPEFHPELASANIRCIYVSEASKQKNGKPVRGKSYKMSGKNQFLAGGCDFLIEVALDCWNESNNVQRKALVDHLLEQCTGEESEDTGEMKWRMRNPDVHEFSTILERHGAWTEELEGLVNVANTLKLESLAEEVQNSVVKR